MTTKTAGALSALAISILLVGTALSGLVATADDTPAAPVLASTVRSTAEAGAVAGQSTSGEILWIRQFGSSVRESFPVIAADISGVYVAGYTWGALPGQTSSGEMDVFVRKYDPNGNGLWTSQFGSSTSDYPSSIILDTSGVYVWGMIADNSDSFLRKYDPNGNELWTWQLGISASSIALDASGFYVVGSAFGALPGPKSMDAVVRKYDPNGNELWTHEFGSSEDDYGSKIALDASGAYVAGHTYGALPGQSSAGGRDVFLRKYDQSGNELWTSQFGSLLDDLVSSFAADNSGVYVAGRAGGALPGQTSAGFDDAFVRKYDPSGNELWTSQFGTPYSEGADSIALDASGVYVAGTVYGDLPGQTGAGNTDAYVRKYDPNGDELWTRQFGTPDYEGAGPIALDASGVYVAGGTPGVLPGQTSAGGFDAFVRKYDPSGSELWTSQFGSSGGEGASSIALDASGVYVAGYTNGALPGETSAGDVDVFVAKLSPVSGPQPQPPSAPQTPQASPGDAQVTLAWQAPSSDGGSPITNYKIYRGTSPGGEVLLTTVGNVLTYVDSGLTNGVTYHYQVSAVNAIGEGQRSNEVSATPTAGPTAPSAPRNLQAAAGNTQVTLTWEAPSSDGGSPITNYRIYSGTTSGSLTLRIVVGNVVAYTDTGLSNGQTYYYRVSAVNAIGEGPRTTEIPATPSAPADTTDPAVAIVSPTSGATLPSTTVTVSGTASDNVAIQKVELSKDGTTWVLATGTTSWSGSLTLDEGAGTIYARATDTSGNTATVSIPVAVQIPDEGAEAFPLALVGGGVAAAAVAAAAALVLLRRRGGGKAQP